MHASARTVRVYKYFILILHYLTRGESSFSVRTMLMIVCACACTWLLTPMQAISMGRSLLALVVFLFGVTEGGKLWACFCTVVAKLFHNCRYPRLLSTERYRARSFLCIP